MTSSTPKSAFWSGFAAGLPFTFVVSPIGVLFGVLATEAGLDVVETLMFSIMVIAGAAQFTALQLMQDSAPTVIVLASALAVNLRMAMYSAALTPHLGAAPMWKRSIIAYFLVDQSFACSMAEYERQPDMTLGARIAFFAGTVTPVCPLWYVCTLAGALIGTRIPEAYALDFAVPITFLALVTPMLRTMAHVVAALVAIVVALLGAGIPFNLGLIVAGAAGMMAGARTELWMERKGMAI